MMGWQVRDPQAGLPGAPGASWALFQGGWILCQLQCPVPWLLSITASQLGHCQTQADHREGMTTAPYAPAPELCPSVDSSLQRAFSPLLHLGPIIWRVISIIHDKDL